ncbi:MAG: hypothetical protein JWL77_6783 [Chthonomonadaceae bacterium]|jgi:hypothetical protein|nr:hypothetical protein [Chthonomonadaceae bacterium]
MTTTVTTHGIAESMRARIAAVREELERYDALREELARLESALADLEPKAPKQRHARNSKSSATTTRRSRVSQPTPARSTSPRARASSKPGPRSQVRERIIEFLRAQGPATAGEVATGLNLNRNSVASRLSQLKKAGVLERVERLHGARAQRNLERLTGRRTHTRRAHRSRWVVDWHERGGCLRWQVAGGRPGPEQVGAGPRPRAGRRPHGRSDATALGATRSCLDRIPGPRGRIRALIWRARLADSDQRRLPREAVLLSLAYGGSLQA